MPKVDAIQQKRSTACFFYKTKRKRKYNYSFIITVISFNDLLLQKPAPQYPTKHCTEWNMKHPAFLSMQNTACIQQRRLDDYHTVPRTFPQCSHSKTTFLT